MKVGISILWNAMKLSNVKGQLCTYVEVFEKIKCWTVQVAEQYAYGASIWVKKIEQNKNNVYLYVLEEYT